jgi:Tfp pilus assembly protein PilF
VEARVRLGDLLLQTGHTDEAAAQFEVALRNDPANFGAQLGYAWILLNNGDAGAALRRFESLLRQQPDNMRVLFGSGLCLIHLERLTEAQRIFEQIMQRQPDYWQALGNLAGIYERTGQLQMAYEAYRRLLLLRPQDETARRWLAEHGG